jgi:cytochrome P450
LSEPVKSDDGTAIIREIPIRKGQNLIVGFGAVNKLKTIWGEDAYEWKPERWLEPLPASVTDARIAGVYSSL